MAPSPDEVSGASPGREGGEEVKKVRPKFSHIQFGRFVRAKVEHRSKPELHTTQFVYSPQHLSNDGLDLEQNIAVKCNILTTQFRNISVSQ